MTDLLLFFADFARRAAILRDSYLVGGTVRDLLIGKVTKDFDVVVRGNPFVLGKDFAGLMAASFVALDQELGIVRVVKEGSHLDLSAMRGETIGDDLSERDLTINAMAVPLASIQSLLRSTGFSDFPRAAVLDHLIDPFGGKRDLDYGMVRMVSEENLSKDPLRLLRVYRFSSTLGFLTDINTSVSVRRLAPLIAGVAVERVAEELRHILRFGFSGKTLKELDAVGLLIQVLPEIRHIPADAWHRSLRSYTFIEHILQNLALYFPGHSPAVASYFTEDYRLLGLKLAALFSFGTQGDQVASRLKMSNREVSFIRKMQADSPRMAALLGAPTSARVRFLRDCGDGVYPLAVLVIAAHHVCQCNDDPILEFCRELLRFYHEEFLPRVKLLPLVTGDDLRREFRLTPSPVFREVLSGVTQLILEGRISTKKEALQAVEDMLKEERVTP